MGELNEMVFKGHDNQILTNSLLVAEKFGKEPNDVVRAIDNLLQYADNECDVKVRSMFVEYTEDEELNPKMGLDFVLDSYEDSTGKNNSVYVMNKKGFSILVMANLVK